jgi:C4-dicarboxylate-specific signal transduction histidine kinase
MQDEAAKQALEISVAREFFPEGLWWSHPGWRQTLGVTLPTAALGLTLLLHSSVSITGYVFFYAAVVAASWFGGRLAGAIAVILSVSAVEYFFLPPVHSFGLHPASLPVFIEFASSATVIGWFSSWRREAESALKGIRDELQTRVEQRTAELRRINQQLLAEIAERKRAEESYYEAQAELARVSRLSALGVLSASISHEVNQPLAAMVTNADACAMWLACEPPNLDEARAAVDSIARDGTRAGDIVRRIRAMFSKASPEMSRVQLNDVIGEVAMLMQTEISKNQVALNSELAADLPNTMADRVQLQQVIANLVLNAIEAMGHITVRERRLLIRTERLPGAVLVAVSDSGVGISPADKKRMFNAFYTTKQQGMGMGLSISRSIIDAHGGQLWATANGDFGATLQFSLPADV